MILRRLLIPLFVVAGLIAGPVALGADNDLAGDPLERGALLALPSVYRVDVTLSVPRVRTAAGEVIDVPGGAAIAERGTATAVAPDGWLITAAHLVDPNPRTLARIGYQRWQAAQGVTVTDVEARRWVIESDARAIGGRVLAVRVTQADPGAGLTQPRRWTGTVRETAVDSDLSLVRIVAPGAPALRLQDAVSIGTPIVTIGFGRHDAWDDPGRPAARPAVRRGRLERTGVLQDPRRVATVVSTDVQSGDSGGPAVDERGVVRGIVVLRGEGGGIMEQAGAVRRLMERAGIALGEGPTAAHFRRGMQKLWALDTAGAERDFATTRSLFPAHTLAATEALRAAALADATYRIEGTGRRRSLLLGIAAVALVLAGLCALRLAWLSAEARPPRRT